MTQEQKAAAWDALVQLMTSKDLTLENWAQSRRMFLADFVNEWVVLAAKRRGADYTIELYRGNDPLAALKIFGVE